MARTPRSKHRQSLEFDIKQLNGIVNDIVTRIENGDPPVYIMGYKYPEEFDQLISSATHPSKLNFARDDLARSINQFSNIADTLRGAGMRLIEFADAIDGRDDFVLRDLKTLQDIASTLKPEVMNDVEDGDEVVFPRRMRTW